MKLLTKTPVAVIIMIVSIVLSAVLGCGRSLKKERSNVEDYFYNGEDTAIRYRTTSRPSAPT